MGYWFFYGGDSRLWLDGITNRYLESAKLIAVSFTVPVLGIVFAPLVRFRARGYFVLLVVGGTIIGVGAFASPRRSPAGSAFESLSRESDLVLSLRNTQRAAPLVVFGLVGLVAAGVSALEARHARLAYSVAAVAALSAAAALPNQWTDGLIAPRFSRPAALPDAWLDAAAFLDAGDGRVLEVPGIDFGAYRWGHTLDPISVGLTRRPIITRELIPIGGPPGASLLVAFDRSMQEGWFEPQGLPAVSRLLGASQLLVRNDLEYERYRTVRPSVLWPELVAARAAIGEPREFGAGYHNAAVPERPLIDEIELARPRSAAYPQLAVFSVAAGRPLVSAVPLDRFIVVSGDGEGVVAAAAAGLLRQDSGPLFLASDLLEIGAPKLPAGATARYVVTDSNRKREQRWYSLRENVGATETADAPIDLRKVGDTRLDNRSTADSELQTTVVYRGATSIWANAYGSPFTLLPEDRPSNAFDGDRRTAWRVDTESYRPPEVELPHRVGIDLGRAVSADHLDLVQPQGRAGTRAITRAQVVLDERRSFEVNIDAARALDPEAFRVALDGEPFSRVEVQILEVSPDPGPAGFAEIAIPGVTVDEIVRLPERSFAALGSAKLAESAVAIVLSRQRANPAEPVRADPEPALARLFTLPTGASFTLAGTARVAPAAPDAALDRLFGRTASVQAAATDHLPGDLGSTAAAALDGNLDTAWQTTFVSLVGQRWSAKLADPVLIRSLDIAVVNDARHSLPRRLLITIGDGTPFALDIPRADPGEAGAVLRVRAELDRAVTTQAVSIEIGDVYERTTTDWYSNAQVALPVALAEVGGLPALVQAPGHDFDSGCRSDLATLDGIPLPLRVTGTSQEVRRGLRVESCSSAELSIGPGEHVLRTVAGRDSGLDIDRLVFVTPKFSEPTGAAAAAPAVEVRSSAPTRASAVVQSDGKPFLLVLDQSRNDGWRPHIDGARVSKAITVDSFANGWIVEPDAPGTLAVTITWAPERAAKRALAVSAISVVACVLLAFRGRRAHRLPAEVPALALPGPGGRRSAVVATAASLVTVLAVGPVAVLPVAIVVVVAGRSGRWRSLATLLPSAVIVIALASVPIRQARSHYMADSRWPNHFGTTHWIVLAALIALGAVSYLAEPAPLRRTTPREDHPA